MIRLFLAVLIAAVVTVLVRPVEAAPSPMVAEGLPPAPEMNRETCLKPDAVLRATTPDAFYITGLPDGATVFTLFAANLSTTLNVVFGRDGCAVTQFQIPRAD